jgi:two-component system chemotaxis sensor kinase CheA
MTNVSKNRKISVIAMIIMTIAWLSAIATIWNTLLISEVKHEGWIYFFMIVVLGIGLLLFYTAYVSSDSSILEKIKREAFASGKAELFEETEKLKHEELKQKDEDENEQKTIDAILAGIHNVRSANGLCNKLLIALAKEIEIVQGIMYIKNIKDSLFSPAAEYALTNRKPDPFKEGDTLPGQTAQNKIMSVLYDVPENYFTVSSGLGASHPKYLLLVPVVINDECFAVLELAAFRKPSEKTGLILDKVLSEVGPKLHKLITA